MFVVFETNAYSFALNYLVRFHHPEGVAVDHMGYVFVADTGNNAIRMISPWGYVTTIAGDGEPGFRNGSTSNSVQFTSPSGVAIWRDWEWWPYPNPIDPDSSLYNNGDGALVVFVADTGNHQIRKIVLNVTDDKVTLERTVADIRVECFSGHCSTNNVMKLPQPGYSDGSKDEARFDSPRGLAISDDGDVYVVDTNNHLIRKIDRFGKAETIAGTTQLSERNAYGEPLEGCPSPCLSGVQGRQDGAALLEAKFSFPTDLAMSANKKGIFVTDRHHIRYIDLVQSRVDTLAGTDHESERDGFGSEASFNKPEGITVTADGYVYISDSTSCRVRRAFYQKDKLPDSTCSDTLTSLFRPSGCSSYNAESDSFGLKVTAISESIYYNYLSRNLTDDALGEDFVGRGIKDCVGSPPIRKIERDTREDDILVIQNDTVEVREDPNDGSLLTVSCPSNCAYTAPIHEISHAEVGEYMYTEDTSICAAAIHSGIHSENEGGLVDVILRKLELPITLAATTEIFLECGQFFSVKASSSDLTVHTIAGAPSTLTEHSCGRKDAIPPQGAEVCDFYTFQLIALCTNDQLLIIKQFRTPTAVSTFANDTLDDLNHFLFIADRNNNAIRVLSATCSFPCENEGRCVGPDQCKCKSGWEGVDCTRPACLSPCDERQVCVAPDQCACIPGYNGDNCTEATCVQTCENGGFCSAPDTCTCSSGWFDTNCTTPVCEQTCGNGGNCTDPNTCSCPTDWGGYDCRSPVCEQQCQSGGSCVAPNTCQCPPDWSGFDCSQPVCHQGHFEMFDTNSDISELYWLEYRPCNISVWCSKTKSFECNQEDMAMISAAPLHGQEWR